MTDATCATSGNGPASSPPEIDWAELVRRDTGPATASRGTYTPKRLRPRHRNVVMLHESGLKNKEIAEMTGYTVGRVSIILASKHPGLMEIRRGFAVQVADAMQDVSSRLALSANEMLDVQLFHARRKVEDPTNSRQAAKDILQMAGFSPVKKSMVLNATMPEEDLEKLQEATLEANRVVAKYGNVEVMQVASDAD